MTIRSVRTFAFALLTGLLLVPAVSAEEKDIVDTAVGAGKFQTLAKALTEAGLIETLKGEGPFTVFAPTDAAFAKIPEEKLSAILKDKELLKAILTYHVASGKFPAAKVVTVDEVKTVQGQPIKVKVDGKKVMLNGSAAVINANIMCSNGVIHVIDTVLLPPKAE